MYVCIRQNLRDKDPGILINSVHPVRSLLQYLSLLVQSPARNSQTLHNPHGIYIYTHYIPYQQHI